MNMLSFKYSVAAMIVGDRLYHFENRNIIRYSIIANLYSSVQYPNANEREMEICDNFTKVEYKYVAV